MELGWKRTYRGRVIGLSLIATDEFGTRHYQVHFKSGMAYYQWPKKRTLSIAVGAMIRFTCRIENNPLGKLYIIEEVLDSSYIDELNRITEHRNRLLSEHIMDAQ